MFNYFNCFLPDSWPLQFISAANQLISAFKKDLRAKEEELQQQQQQQHDGNASSSSGAAGSSSFSEQRLSHLEGVVDFLEVRLRLVCDLYAGRKAVRVEREMEVKKMARLEHAAGGGQRR